jgi:hypothetical protein
MVEKSNHLIKEIEINNKVILISRKPVALYYRLLECYFKYVIENDLQDNQFEIVKLNKTELINITNQAIQDILNLINGLDTQKYKGEFGKKSVESKRWVKGSELHDLNFINKDNQFAFFEEVKSTNRKPNSKRPNSLRWQSP